MKYLSIISISFFIWCLGCGDDLHNYQDCVKIETARCDLRDRCLPGFDVETCFAYYREYCRTREISEAFSKSDVPNCVDAIDSLETSEECARLDELSGDESELCTFSELEDCASFLCDEYEEEEEDDDSTEEDSDSDTDVPSGLEPN